MSVFGRVADILQAKTHKLLDRMEDPNETLDLSYEKMIAGLEETKVHLADVVAQQKSLERQIAAAEQEAGKAENDARLALQANREDLAKAALAHKHSALEKLQSLNEAHAAILPQAQKLIDYEQKLEQRIEKFRVDKEVMKTSYTAAAAQVKVSQSLAGVGTSFNNVSDTLRRAEDKVSGMRAKADAIESLTESGVLSDPLDSRRKEEKELDALRVGSAIDGDLAKLKAELAAGKDAKPGA
ncbi:MAG TPA: PspA/IM30 family protein [Stellaceae bacterium]|nr:PspA/IM30 family protein [Stellaceae bacterium]